MYFNDTFFPIAVTRECGWPHGAPIIPWPPRTEQHWQRHIGHRNVHDGHERGQFRGAQRRPPGPVRIVNQPTHKLRQTGFEHSLKVISSKCSKNKQTVCQYFTMFLSKSRASFLALHTFIFALRRRNIYARIFLAFFCVCARLGRSRSF